MSLCLSIKVGYTRIWVLVSNGEIIVIGLNLFWLQYILPETTPKVYNYYGLKAKYINELPGIYFYCKIKLVENKRRLETIKSQSACIPQNPRER
jgi:hypothetical protein